MIGTLFTSVRNTMSGDRLMARALRAAAAILLGQGGSQALRLASNLILTRLLFPEAFGIMAIVAVVTVGLAMFSDVGVGPSISQSKRGDDQVFLDTAWSIQVIRGLLLCGITGVLALPVANFYGEPALAMYLPVAGLSLAIAGFNPTRIETAHRHLLLGRVTALDLLSQFIGITSMVIMAYLMQSVWALVIGGLVAPLAKLMLTWFFLPGAANRFKWERPAAQELLNFGKWIFLSTACYFLTSQGDKAILGRFLTLEILGIYNIGFFLANFPAGMGHVLVNRLLIPLYREKPPTESAENAARIGRMRLVMTVSVMSAMLVMAYGGPWIVDLLYDPRYEMSGAIVVGVALGLLPHVIGMSYDQSALAAGDSRTFFVYTSCRAVLGVAFILIGVTSFGLVGALIGMGASHIVSHPVLIWLARRHGAHDMRHDLIATAAALVAGGGAVLLHWDALMTLPTEVVRGF